MHSGGEDTMGMWDGCADGSLIGVLTRVEIGFLGAYAAGLVQLAEYGLASCSWVEGSTEDRGRLFPGEAVSDSRIMGMVRRHVSEGAADWADWEVALRAPDCLSDSVAAARRVSDTLPASGGVVVLAESDDVHVWCRFLGDVIATLEPYASGKSAEIERRAAWARVASATVVGSC
jgi:hypothetical protein